MDNVTNDEIRMHMLVAFGQGTGCMFATTEALTMAFAKSSGLMDRAADDWRRSQWAFLQLVRLIGQTAAVRAAIDNSPEIRIQHMDQAMNMVLSLCPC